MIWLLAMGGMAGAQILNADAIYRSADYPNSGWSKEHAGVNKVRVIVSPTGNAERCEIIVSTGDSKLNEAACGLMLKRGRFKPALDPNGVPIYGAVTRFVVWHSSGSLRLPVNIDVEIQLSKMPPNSSPEEIFGALLAVDEAGKVTACESGSAETPPVLRMVACRQLRSSGTIEPAQDRSGTPVASVQYFNVKISAPSAKP